MRVLFISSLNINAVAGVTVQLAADMNMWSNDNEVEFYSSFKLFSSKIIESISSNVNLIFPTVKNNTHKFSLNSNELIEKVVELDKKNPYDLIICRGSKLLWAFFNIAPKLFSEKCLMYMTDLNELSYREEKKLFKNAFLIRGQSEGYADLVSKKYGINKKKMIIQPPIIEEIPPLRNVKKEYDVIYVGKIGKHWGVLEYLKGVEQNPKWKSAIIYSLLLNNNKNEHSKIENLLSLENLVVKSNISKEEALKELSKAKVSYCMRDIEIDNENSTEISTKLLESMMLDVPIIIRRTKLHENILGKDYPYFINSYSEFPEAVERAIKSEEKINLRKKVEKYFSQNVYKDLINQLKERGVYSENK